MSHSLSNPNPALQLPQRFAPALPPPGHTPKTSPLDTVQLRSPDEFPLNHFRNLRKENKVTTSAAVELQGSLCCYSFSQGHTWLNALTGKSFNILLEHLSEFFFFLPASVCSLYSANTFLAGSLTRPPTSRNRYQKPFHASSWELCTTLIILDACWGFFIS